MHVSTLSTICIPSHVTLFMYMCPFFNIGPHLKTLATPLVNSSLCLEKNGCSQTLIKVGGVLIYKWVEHVPDT